MAIISLEDAGFRKLCPRSFVKAQQLKAALQTGGYEIIEGDDFLFCKPVDSTKTFIALEHTLSKENFRQWDEIIGSLKFLYDPRFEPDLQTYMKDDDIGSMLKSVLEKPMPESLHALTGLLFWSHRKQLEDVLKRVARAFIEKYPTGRLHFIRIDKNLEGMQAVGRVLTAVDGFGFEVIEKPEILKENPSRLLSRVHPQTIEPITEATLNSLLSAFFRLIYGTSVMRLGGLIVVQIDPPHVFEFPYQRQRWDFNRLHGILQPDSGIDLEEYLRKGTLNKDQQRRAYRRHLFEEPWTANDFENLIEWTIEQVNKLFALMLDLCNYTTGSGFVDFIRQRKVFLTVERIIVEINYILTELDPFVRKILYFNLHDKIATLLRPDAGQKERRIIFNRLFKKTHYEAVLRQHLTRLPQPFSDSIAKLGDTLFGELMDECLASVWARHRISDKAVFTREPTDKRDGYITERMRDRTDGPYVPEDFAVNFLHEIRNSLHGYQLQASKFEEFLLMHFGDVPDILPDLTLIWYFLLLADSGGLLSGEWRRGVSPRERSNCSA